MSPARVAGKGRSAVSRLDESRRRARSAGAHALRASGHVSECSSRGESPEGKQPLRRAGADRIFACVALVALCAACGDASSAALRPIDQSTLQATLDASARDLLVPGAMALVRVPQGEFVVTHGATARGGDTPPGPDTRFRIGSVTKSMTAALILQLAQEGKLRLDDPIAKYRPDVPGGDDIPIADLLDMRSGLGNYTAAPTFWPVLEDDPGRVWTPEQLLEIGFAQPSPGSRSFYYCNTNTVLLGLVAQQVTGQPLATLFQERLFAPLGMSATQLPAPGTQNLPAPSARGYVYESVRYVFVEASYPPSVQEEARAGTLAPKDFTDIDPSWAWAAGGAISTASDLAIWIEGLVGGRLLDATWQRRWRDSLRPTDPARPDGQQYGYGIAQARFGAVRLFFHNGELPGFNTFASHDPENRVTIVVWTSLPVAVDGRAPAETIAVALAGRVYAELPAPAELPAS